MISRIPESERQRSIQSRIARTAGTQAAALERLATQKKINRPSDDPAGTVRVLDLSNGIARTERYQDNALRALQWNEFASEVLLNVSDVMARTRELTIQGTNASLSAGDREALAAEVESLLQEALELANTEVAGRSVFGGQSGSGIDQLGSGNGVRSFQANGSGVPSNVTVGEGVSVALGPSAGEVFLEQKRAQTRFVGGDTGARPGAGTDSATGFGSLQVTHTATTLGDGAGPGGADSVTGVAPGSSSAGGDTVLGSSHSIAIRDTSALADGSQGVVSLNGGPEVSFTNADTDLALTGPDGEVVYLDLSSVTGGTNTSLGLSASGQLSVDGGATSSAITFADQTLGSSVDGTVVSVDSSQITRTGEEQLTFAGTFGILGTLQALAADLRNDRKLEDQTQAAELSAHLSEIDRAEGSLAEAFARVGAAAARATAAEELAQELKIGFTELKSSAEDADFVTTVLEVQRAQEAFEATLRATAQSQGLSLLDFLN